MSPTVSVLFVCLGNICRSPTAEAVFREKVKDEGLDELIDIESCGLGTWNLGNPPHPDTQAILKAKGIPFDGMRAKRLAAERINAYDYVIAMDHENVEGLQRLGIDNDKIQLLTEYVPGKEGEAVPDPYYFGNFEGVFDLIEAGVQGLLDHIKTNTTFSAHPRK